MTAHAADDDLSASPPTLITDLAGLHDYARQVLTAATQLPASPATDAIRGELVRAAQRVVELAAEPITIGVVGEYSAGKSLLLGLLLGKPDLLPVSDDATTANVTALHLTQGVADQPTCISAATVQYLSAPELDECLQHMLDELAARARAAGLATSTIDSIRTQRGHEMWIVLEHWCRAVAWPTQKPRLTLLVRELMRLRDAALAAPALLGWTTTVHPQVFNEALLLPKAVPDPSAFPQQGVGVPGLGARPSQLDSEQLRATLPLVKRVTLDVGVPRGVWDLSELRGHNQLTLLDFPGLNSTISGVRDRYLARRELADVTTIFILLNALAAGSDGPTEFHDMMQSGPDQLRDRVLVGIGRFDQLPNLVSPELYAPDGFARKVTDRRLVDEVLSAVMSNARLLAGAEYHERIHFHSAMVGIDALNRQRPGVSHYSAEFATQRQLAEHVPRALKEAEKWFGVVNRLALDDPGSTLRPALGAFCADGGVQRIRERLERHVKEHGLALRVGRLAQLAELLEASKQQAMNELRHDNGPDPAVAAAREPLQSLLESVRHQLTDLAATVPLEIADPALARLPGGRSLTRAVQQHVIDDVFAWPEWANLFTAVQDCMITPQDTDPYDIPDDDEQEANATSLPATTTEFAARFNQAVTTCRQHAMDLAWESLQEWARQASATMAPARQLRTQLIGAEAAQRLHQQFGERGFPQRLTQALDLSWLPAKVRKPAQDQLARLSGDGPDLAAAFPLRADTWFAWNPAMPRQVRDAAVATLARHQVRPARLRRELVNGVTNIVLTELGRLQKEIAGYARRQLTRLEDDLKPAELFIQTVLGVTEQAETDPAAGLDAVKPPSSTHQWQA